MEKTHCFMCQELFNESEMVVRSGEKWCKPCNKEQDFYNDIMHEAYEEEHNYTLECQRINDRIFKAVERLKGKEFINDLTHYAKDCEAQDKFRIVRKPAGDRQKENFGQIQEAWVDQMSSGDSGDSFYGTVSVKIKEGRWLEMPFAT